jgi:hypothetical protein
MVDIFTTLDNVKKTMDAARGRNEVSRLMARLSISDEPTEANVEPGDNLILIDDIGGYRRLAVTEVGLVGVYAGGIYVEYCDAVVEKPRKLTRAANAQIYSERDLRKNTRLLDTGRYLIGAVAKRKISEIARCNPSAN